MTSLITSDTAAAYFSARLDSRAWSNASPSDQLKALTQSTRIIDNFAYIGEKTIALQEHEWPRKNIMDVDTATVPDGIVVATCEIAASLLGGFDIEKEIRNIGVTSRQFAGVRTTYAPNSVPEYITVGVPSAIAWANLKPFFTSAGTIILHRVS